MIPVRYHGVGYLNLLKANRLTVPGSLSDVARYRYTRDMGEGAAIASVATGIKREYMPGKLNPYREALANSAGLGSVDEYGVDVDALPMTSYTKPMSSGTLATTGAASDSGWMNILGTFVGNVSQGLAARIGGYGGKVPVSAPIAAPTSAIPSWAKLALIGGGGLILLNVLRKRA